MSNKHKNLKALGRRVTKFTKLETFVAPVGLKKVVCTSEEVTALCPVTGQPDWYVVDVEYQPKRLCIESKTLKLYLQSFRQQGHFCEDFSGIIAGHVFNAIKPTYVTVTVTQKPRGGVAIKATSSFYA